ncbi:MAG: nicotinate-nucleotide--dimethylbenzimidazole phosphoribosyltransferase [Promethearchaeota archaeon]
MDVLKKTINQILPIKNELKAKTQKRLDALTKPLGSLGMLEEVAKDILAITENEGFQIRNKVIFVLAGDHGVVNESVTGYPQEVTPQMVYNFVRGGAAINVLARHVGAKVVVVDMGVAANFDEISDKIVNKKINYGTKNFAAGPAMSKDEAIRSIEAGIEIFKQEAKKGIDIVGCGDMGIGNTTTSSAIVAALTGAPVEQVTGRGTGIDDETLAHKIDVIKKALAKHNPDPADPIDVLSKVGGFEIGGIAGVILAAAAHKVPILLDGFISSAGALIAYKLQPNVKDYFIASHLSVERGHQIILETFNKRALLNLDLRLGEGTGAALAMPLVEASIKILNEMATFADAGVSERTS